MLSYLPHWVFYLFFTLLILNAICAVGLVIRELAQPPRRFRAWAIRLLLLAAIVISLQLATDYYFAFFHGETAAHLGAVLAYLSIMALVVSGRRMAWHFNGIVGVLGLGMPLLLSRMSPVLPVVVALEISRTQSFQGRISPDTSYVIAIDHTLIGATEYCRYTIFHNPRRLPIFWKQIASGPIYSCDVPVFAAGVSAGPNETLWKVWCRPTNATLLEAEVSPANSAAWLKAKDP